MVLLSVISLQLCTTDAKKCFIILDKTVDLCTCQIRGHSNVLVNVQATLSFYVALIVFMIDHCV